MTQQNMIKDKPVILIATNHSYMFYRFRRQLAQELVKKYHVVLSTPFVGHEQDLRDIGLELRSIELDRRSISGKKDLRLIKQYQKLLDDVQPEFVLTFSIKPNVYLGGLCAQKRIPYFTHVQGLGTAFQKPLIREAAKFLYKTGLRKAKNVFFENQANLDFFVEHHLIPDSKAVRLSGAGIDLEEYPIEPYPDNSEFHILYLGRIMKEKGMDELLESLKNLHERGVNFLFDFAGFYEDSYKDTLDEMVKQGYAVDHGFVEDPRPLYAMCDAVVLPSWHEGMSNVLLEAAASGRPLIASNIPGCKESIIDHKSGYLVPVRDQSALEASILKMIETPRSERELMGRTGRKHMEKCFSKETVVQETMRYLVTYKDS